MLHSSRRRFIAGLGAASGEYMLEPGLIHLNTGTLGAMPRTVFERARRARHRRHRASFCRSHTAGNESAVRE